MKYINRKLLDKISLFVTYTITISFISVWLYILFGFGVAYLWIGLGGLALLTTIISIFIKTEENQNETNSQTDRPTKR